VKKRSAWSLEVAAWGGTLGAATASFRAAARGGEKIEEEDGGAQGSQTVPLHNGAIPTAVSTGLCSSHLLAHKGNECNFRASYLGRGVMVAQNEFASSFKGCMQPLQYHF
jgi:hypothetical protein